VSHPLVGIVVLEKGCQVAFGDTADGLPRYRRPETGVGNALSIRATIQGIQGRRLPPAPQGV
jgi:hypothetical protein